MSWGYKKYRNLVVIIVVVATILISFIPFAGIGYHHELQKDFYFMKLIPLTQGKFALVDDEYYEYLHQWKWCAHRQKHTFYAVRNIVSNGKKKTHAMHRELLNSGILYIDHKDGNGLNNQRDNLRIASRGQNAMNLMRGQ